MPAPVRPSAAASMEPPRKRTRLSDAAYGEITEREMKDVETSLEVDHMILDYLVYQALVTCLSNPHSTLDSAASPVERTLLQFDEFYALFKRRYPRYILDDEIRFRQQLLQLIALFTQRVTRNSTTLGEVALHDLREKNGARARRWIGDASRLPTASVDVELFDAELPLRQEDLEDNRVHVLGVLGALAEDYQYDDAFYGTGACVSLLDLLPLFMKITAGFFNYLDKSMKPNQGWLGLACDWMLQAVLEQYLVFGASGSDAMDEAFAWGHKEKEAREQDKDAQEEDDDFVNGMFEEDGVAMQGWQEVRAVVLEKLARPAQPDGLHAHLLDLAAAYPIERTEESVMFFLRSINECIPTPVLAQLENGQLDGMSKDETKSFIQNCGLDLASFLVV